jgi:hypothetical protein
VARYAAIALLALAAARHGWPGPGTGRPKPHALRTQAGQKQYFEVHYTLHALAALCPYSAELPEWRLLDAGVLLRLGDTNSARAELSLLLELPDMAERARALLGYSFATDRDDAALAESLARSTPATRSRLQALTALPDADAFARVAQGLDRALLAPVQAAEARYRAAPRKRPAAAGLLSAVIPGLGQAYAGSWSGAAVALALTGTLAVATVELARHDLPWAAGATGLMGSVFYVGNVMNAVDLAERVNERATRPAYDELEQLLLPELP